MVYTIEQIKEKIAPVAQKYQLPAVYIFGSYARGDATADSDVDILVDRTDAKLQGLFAFGGLFNDFSEAFDKPVDLITTQALKQESTKEMSPDLIENIYKERRVVYEKK